MSPGCSGQSIHQQISLSPPHTRGIPSEPLKPGQQPARRRTRRRRKERTPVSIPIKLKSRTRIQPNTFRPVRRTTGSFCPSHKTAWHCWASTVAASVNAREWRSPTVTRQPTESLPPWAIRESSLGAHEASPRSCNFCNTVHIFATTTKKLCCASVQRYRERQVRAATKRLKRSFQRPQLKAYMPPAQTPQTCRLMSAPH